MIYGSASLADTLRKHDLIDEYRLWVHPIIIGKGKRLFKEGSDATTLELIETKSLRSGVVILSYRPVEKGRR